MKPADEKRDPDPVFEAIDERLLCAPCRAGAASPEGILLCDACVAALDRDFERRSS